MSATVDPMDPTALPFRVWTLERNETRVADKVSKLEDNAEAQGKTQAEQAVEIRNLTASVNELKDAVKWTNRILVGLCLSITGSAVGVVFTLGGHL